MAYLERLNLITLNHDLVVLREAYSVFSRHQNAVSPKDARITIGCLELLISDIELEIKEKVLNRGSMLNPNIPPID